MKLTIVLKPDAHEAIHDDVAEIAYDAEGIRVVVEHEDSITGKIRPIVIHYEYEEAYTAIATRGPYIITTNFSKREGI